MIFWLAVVGIPYLALLALTAIEGRGEWPTLSRRAIEVGIDACILGIGVSGALFGSHEVRVRIGDAAAVIAVAAIFIDLIITGICLQLRSTSDRFSEEQRAKLSLFLGVLILAINTGIAF